MYNIAGFYTLEEMTKYDLTYTKYTKHKKAELSIREPTPKHIKKTSMLISETLKWANFLTLVFSRLKCVVLDALFI